MAVILWNVKQGLLYCWCKKHSFGLYTMNGLERLLPYFSSRKYYSFDCFYRIVHIKLKDHFATQYYNKFLLGNRENEKLSIGRFVIAFNTSLSNGRKFLPTKTLPSTCVRKEKKRYSHLRWCWRWLSIFMSLLFRLFWRRKNLFFRQWEIRFKINIFF